MERVSEVARGRLVKERRLTVSAHVDNPKTNPLVGRKLDLEGRLLSASGVGGSGSRAVVDAVTVDETRLGRGSSDGLCGER